ncbi:retrovirus-related pol polyprotein from transposon TNT 1-94 [Tanacetum coccineum]
MTIKNKVEAQPRKVNKKNRVVEPICDVDVKHSLLKANSKLICTTRNKSMFDGAHDMCLLDFVENVNSHAKSAKKHKKINIWKPTGHVFTKVGLKWKPTGRTFTIVANSCPLTRITLANVVPIVLCYLDSRCSKHMTGNHSQLMNFVSKFLGIIRFRNDHIARIIGYGDYQLGNVTISRVYYVEGHGHDLFSVGQFCNADLEVLAKDSLARDNGTEFVNQTLCEFYENVGISHQTSVDRNPQQNNILERQNRTLIEAACTMLIFSKAPLFLWAEVINIACYTQNRSLIHLRYNKTPYELMQDKKPDLSFFHVFGSLCYSTNDNDDLGKLDAKADIGIFVHYAPAQKAFRIYNKRTRKIIETIHVTFDELTAMASKQFSSGPGLHSMTPATSSSVQEVAAPRAVVLADSPMSNSIDQDAPSLSIPSTKEQEHSPNICQGFEESPKTPIFCDHESLHKESTSQGSSSNVRQTHTPFEHIGK